MIVQGGWYSEYIRGVREFEGGNGIVCRVTW